MSGRSGLRAAMNKKASLGGSEAEGLAAELALADQQPALKVAPAPAGDPAEPPADQGEAATAEPVEPPPVVEPVVEPGVEPSLDPEPIPTPDPPTEPGTEPGTAADPPLQTARVLATGMRKSPGPRTPPAPKPTKAGPTLDHLRLVMAGGRDQRRYVADLPRRSDKGTYLRLPVHLQDVLAEYCDRNDAPMADFIAAVLDGYFRDLGALPPLGEGNRPDEEFFENLRKQARSYDY